MTPAVRELLLGLVRWGVGVAALIGLASIVRIRLDPVALGGGALVVAVAWWLGNRPSAGAVDWPDPPSAPELLSPAAQPDARALARLLETAEPGRGFSTRRLAGELAGLASARLRGRTASEALSAPLARYLATLDDPDAVPPPLSRRTLRAHLKELEDL